MFKLQYIILMVLCIYLLGDATVIWIKQNDDSSGERLNSSMKVLIHQPWFNISDISATSCMLIMWTVGRLVNYMAFYEYSLWLPYG